MILNGFDISKWQAGINLSKLTSADFIILRGAHGTSKDRCFDQFYDFLHGKVNLGVYLYCEASTVEGARKEAEFLYKNVLQGRQFEYPIYYDVEDKRTFAAGRDVVTLMIQTFCNYLAAKGYFVGVYSSKSFFESKMHDHKLYAYTHWVAQYNKNCTYARKYDMWQYTSGKIHAGHRLDANYCYRDFAKEIKAAGLNGFSKSTPTPSVDQVAKDVIAGKYGNGEARKKNIEALGLSYTAVQARVNALLNVHPKPSVDQVAHDIINGKYGNGEQRKQKVVALGLSFDEVQARVNQILGDRTYYPRYTGNSQILNEILKAIGAPHGSWKTRKPLATKNGIALYVGTSAQNQKLITLAKAGKLKRV